MATSISPVARIWLSAPSNSHGQNAAVGHGTWSPVAASTTAKNTIENGKPNRKRILVAPQVPSGPVNCRCIALRATCPSAAVMVKGIQSVAMENMGSGMEGLIGGTLRIIGTVKVAARAVNCQDCMRHPPHRRRLNPLGHHHVVHVDVGGEAPAIDEGMIDHASLFGAGALVVRQVLREFVGCDELVPLMGAARQPAQDVFHSDDSHLTALTGARYGR